MMHRSRYIAGMTFVEMIVALGLYSIISLSLFNIVHTLYQNNSYMFAQADEVAYARRGLYALAQDLREMTYSEDGTFPVVVMEEHRIGFYSDIDRDYSVEYVEYEVASSTLYKYTHNATGSPPTYDFATPDETDVLSEYVQNIDQASSTFRYFDRDNNELTTGALLTDVRYIQVQLIVNIDPLRSPGEFMLQSSVAPRNLKDNL